MDAEAALRKDRERRRVVSDPYADDDGGDTERGVMDDDEDDEDDEDEDGGIATSRPRVLMLEPPPPSACSGANPQDYRHPVRAEPFSGSPIVGYVTTQAAVLAYASCGFWAKVKVHEGRRFSRRNSSAKKAAAARVRDDGFGWCLEAPVAASSGGDGGGRGVGGGLSPSKAVARLVDINSYGDEAVSRTVRSTFEGEEINEDCDIGGSRRGEGSGGAADPFSVGYGGASSSSSSLSSAHGGSAVSGGGLASGGLWHAREDASGRAYYWNDATHATMWEAPAWVEELDEDTGCAYYVRVAPLGR